MDKDELLDKMKKSEEKTKLLEDSLFWLEQLREKVQYITDLQYICDDQDKKIAKQQKTIKNLVKSLREQRLKTGEERARGNWYQSTLFDLEIPHIPWNAKPKGTNIPIEEFYEEYRRVAKDQLKFEAQCKEIQNI